jgi:hypothetical protein
MTLLLNSGSSIMDVTLGRRAAGPSPYRFSFTTKVLGLIATVSLADQLFYGAAGAGTTLGFFAIAVILTVAALRPELRSHPGALAAVGGAAWFAGVMLHAPSLLAATLCWAALSLAVLLPRATRFGNGAAWLLRLLIHTAAAPFRPLVDYNRSRRVRGRVPARFDMLGAAATLVLPVVGTTLFVLLFTIANPLIGEWVGRLDPFAAAGALSPVRLLFWITVAILVWRPLSPRLPRLLPAIDTSGIGLPGASTASVILSLVAFNAIFLVQNALDLHFLWSGAALPDGMSYAEYAHRGAYPLIVTALLAGLFVLLTTRSGSAMAGDERIRLLVSLWIAQNVFLVASTMLRTLAYIDAYSLTELRIQALVWMGLVATGLALICARLWLRRSAAWLVNANLLAVLLVLGASAWIDYDRMAAGWNVRHAREVGGRGTSLDLCYLGRMGDSALLPLIELETKAIPDELRDRVRWVRSNAYRDLAARQSDWRSWTWRGSRRLGAARARIEAAGLPTYKPFARRCDGRAYAVEVAPAAPALTVAVPR